MLQRNNGTSFYLIQLTRPDPCPEEFKTVEHIEVAVTSQSASEVDQQIPDSMWIAGWEISAIQELLPSSPDDEF